MGDETCFDCCTAGYIQDRALGGSAKRDMPISNNTKALTLFTTKIPTRDFYPVGEPWCMCTTGTG